LVIQNIFIISNGNVDCNENIKNDKKCIRIGIVNDSICR